MQRNFNPTEPDRLWVMDVTEHPTGEGKVYLAVVLDAWSRRVVGWSIADHLRSDRTPSSDAQGCTRKDRYVLVSSADHPVPWSVIGWPSTLLTPRPW